MNFIIKVLLVLAVGFGFMTTATAHGPTPQKVDEKIIINADVKTVWDELKQFDNLSQWHPSVASIKMEDETTRVVSLKTGGDLVDSLDEVDTEEHYLSYRLLTENVTAFPVSFYTISLQVLPTDNGSLVNWSGRFYRADTGNFPPENLNDAAAVKVMTLYAKSGLEGLKSKLEK
jgi:hypothetical protein